MQSVQSQRSFQSALPVKTVFSIRSSAEIINAAVISYFLLFGLCYNISQEQHKFKQQQKERPENFFGRSFLQSQCALEKILHLLISQIDVIKQLKELVNFLIHIAINVIGINQCGEPAHTNQTVRSGGTVNPTKRSVGGAVHLQLLNRFQEA